MRRTTTRHNIDTPTTDIDTETRWAENSQRIRTLNGIIQELGKNGMETRKEARDELIFAIAYYRVARAMPDFDESKENRVIARAHCVRCIQTLGHDLSEHELKEFAQFVADYYTC